MTTMQKDEPQVETLEKRAKQLIYRALHRGTREMDMLLGSFARDIVPTLDEQGLDDFEALLDLGDPDLYAWYCKQAQPPANFNNPALDAFLAYQYRI